MKSFDEWVEERYPHLIKSQGQTLAICMQFAKEGYEAGQQSNQAEIDELRKRIKLAIDAVWNDKCSHTVIDILKGNTNED